MPKQLINTVGLLVMLGILAAAALVVALPIYLQSLGTDAQTRSVSDQNATMQAQVDALAAQDVEAVESEAGDLRAQIPDAARVDSVSSLIAAAAAANNVTIVSMTPAAPEAFVSLAAQTPAQAADPAGTEAPADAGAQQVALTGKLQVPIDLEVIGPDRASILAFLDTMRGGPRLLGDIEVTYSERSGDANARIKALAFAATTASAGQQGTP